MDDAIFKGLKDFEVDLAISRPLKLNDFATDLSFNQSNEEVLSCTTRAK